jgi:hypothetical protein
MDDSTLEQRSFFPSPPSGRDRSLVGRDRSASE